MDVYVLCMCANYLITIYAGYFKVHVSAMVVLSENTKTIIVHNLLLLMMLPASSY